MGKYQWQGFDVKITIGLCKVTRNEEKPLYWYNYECATNNGYDFKSALVPAVKIETDTESFCIANHFGIGIHKLINGGWPNYSHFSLPSEGFEKYWKDGFHITEFDSEGYAKHEGERRQWQKESFPEE